VNKKSPNWGLRGGSEKGMKMHMTSIRCASFLPVLAAAIGLIAGCYVPGEESAATPLPPPQQVEKPQLNYSSGTYSGDLAVEITDATPEATIRYTTDGSPPDSSSTAYGGPIAVTGNGTVMRIRACAQKSGMSDSAEAGAMYTINYGQVSTPNFRPPPGIYRSDQTVRVGITDFTEGATILYTTDGSDPKSPSAVLGGSMEVKGPGTWKCFKAYAWKSGMSDSTVASAYYCIKWLVPMPTKVICAELHRQGLMDDAIYTADEAFGRYLRYNQHDVLLGYQLWAKPVAQWMQKSRMVTRIVASLATPWSYEMAYRMGARDKGNAEGKILMDIGVPICRAIGRAMIWIEDMSLLD
jgi:hypothetical protein